MTVQLGTDKVAFDELKGAGSPNSAAAQIRRRDEPLHISDLSTAETFVLGFISVCWPGPTLDPDGYLASDDLSDLLVEQAQRWTPQDFVENTYDLSGLADRISNLNR